jgi:hypothetical protein
MTGLENVTTMCPIKDANGSFMNSCHNQVWNFFHFFSNGSFSVASKDRIIINCVLVRVSKEGITKLLNFVPAFHWSKENQMQAIVCWNLSLLGLP